MGVSPYYLELLVKGLAVLGGAALGWLVIALLTRFLGRWLSARKGPRPLERLVRLLGAVVGGWLVWFLVTGSGGGGLFGGGGSFFGGRGVGEGSGKETAPPSTPRTKRSPAETAPIRRAETLRVVMLGGQRVNDERFYRPEGGEPRTLAELKKVVKDRQKEGGVKALEIVIYEDSVARDHPAVKELEQWARQNDLAVSLALLPGNAP